MFKVAHLAQSYLAALAVRVKLREVEPATYDWYKVAVDRLVSAAGEFPAAELRAHHLVAVEFTNHFVRVLKAVYKWACDEEIELLSRNPFRKLKPPPCGERQRVLSRAEMVRLYSAASSRLRRLLYILRHTIARPGEIRGLRWGDIQWDRRLILLKQFKARKRRRDGVKVRTIPLDRPTLRLLKNIHRRRGGPGPDAPVWLDRYGKAWSANGVRCQMRAARRKAGLDPDGVEERIVCYTLRHTSATNATRAGVRGKVLSDIMGHTRSATTDRYQHLAGDDMVEGIDRLAAARPRRAG